MGRILRLSKEDNQKIYFKVATKNTAGYFVDLMTAALCLFKMEWYSQFNGKNMGGILIPKVKTTRPKPNGKSNPTNKKKQTQRIATLEELGIPLDLNLFNQSIMYSQGDKFSTVAWTTLDKIRCEFFETYTRPKHWNYDKVKSTIDSLSFKDEIRNTPGLMHAIKRYELTEYVNKKLTSRKIKWGCENDIRIEFKKYKTKKELCTKARGAVGAAKDMGVYEKLCNEMGWPKRLHPNQNKKWVKNVYVKIKCYEYPSMKYIKTFESRAAAINETGAEVRRVLNGTYKHSKNYYFEYA
jgi:hypothetical protein